MSAFDFNLPPNPATGLRLRVMLVDDDQACHLMLRGVLESPPPIDVEILFYERLDEALAAAHLEPPDVVLLDLKLADGSSKEDVLASIPSFPAPVIGFTGHETRDVWLDYVSHGAMNCLYKVVYLNRMHRSALMHSIVNAMFMYQVHPQLKHAGK